jgi:hypothetical protein
MSPGTGNPYVQYNLIVPAKDQLADPVYLYIHTVMRQKKSALAVNSGIILKIG